MSMVYEQMRDEFVGQGMDVKDAMKKAAKIFNANRADGEIPVGRGYGKRTTVNRRRKTARRKRRLRR